MSRRMIHTLNIFFLLVLSSVVPLHAAGPTSYRVLVVMSYHESYSWSREIREGIDSVLAGSCELHYVYLDTKNDYSGGAEKAKRFFDYYRSLRPDGVIAADDAAQSLFVVPYLKDKVKTPVMFCGINKDAAEYGYPASNVSGILERAHMKESIAFLQQLVPTVKTFCCLMKEDPSSWGLLQQIRREADTYPARFITAEITGSLREAIERTEKLRLKCDALFLTPMAGLAADDGRHLTSREAALVLSRVFGKATFSDIAVNVESGVLTAVLKSGQEQGATAAAMLQKALQGMPVSRIPITRNMYGKRAINVTVMKRLGIRPRPVVLRGAHLVKTKE